MSEKRDVKSWWSHLKEKTLGLGLEVIGLVSDRAKALVKLSNTEYLNTVSMPDLFHFVQDISKAVGLQIGRKKAQALKKLEACQESGREVLQRKFDLIAKQYKSYRNENERINKIIHPFGKQNEWACADAIEKELRYCFKAIHDIALEARIQISLDKANKILHQIPAIVKGVQAWIEQAKKVLNQWVKNQVITEIEQKWLIRCALPLAYWQAQVHRTQPKARNKDLRQHYKDRVSQALLQYQTDDFTTQLSSNRQEELFLLAKQLAITFQRASSQTEGRNGYLAFINHAHRGFPKNRLQVLTVIHNYDVRRKNGKTPAQRLFRKEFPDLFEFICLNVAGFKEPRRRKP